MGGGRALAVCIVSATLTSAAHAQTKPEPLGDVAEQPGKTYLFVGAHYRGLVLPQFMVNVFADAGATFYSHTVGLEVDIRRNRFSIIPSIDYTDLGTDDTLFLDKGTDPADAGNWAVVNSSLKTLFVSVDLLWSVPLAKSLDFEIGGAVASGSCSAISTSTGSPRNPAAGPPVAGSTRFYKCEAEGPSNCNCSDHATLPSRRSATTSSRTGSTAAACRACSPTRQRDELKTHLEIRAQKILDRPKARSDPRLVLGKNCIPRLSDSACIEGRTIDRTGELNHPVGFSLSSVVA